VPTYDTVALLAARKATGRHCHGAAIAAGFRPSELLRIERGDWKHPSATKTCVLAELYPCG